MPTYRYECPCGYSFEDFQDMPGQPQATCRNCGKQAKKQVGPGAGVIFKGGGFYETDYKGKS